MSIIGRNYCIYATLIFATLYGWRPVCWLEWNSNFSRWWAHVCPKHVEKKNKYTKQNCVPSWIYLQDCSRTHGQQNIKSHREIYFIPSKNEWENSKNITHSLKEPHLNPEDFTTHLKSAKTSGVPGPLLLEPTVLKNVTPQNLHMRSKTFHIITLPQYTCLANAGFEILLPAFWITRRQKNEWKEGYISIAYL